MVDSRLSKMARVLVEYSLSIKEGDRVLINGSDLSLPLIREVYKEALLKGAYPEIKLHDEQLSEILLKYGTDEQIKDVSPLSLYAMENYDAFLRISGSHHTKLLQNYDAGKISLLEVASKEPLRILQQRAFEGKMRWCITQFPTHSAAMEADMSLAEYEEFIFSACFVDREEPVKEWLKLKEEQQKIIDYISTKDHIRIIAPDTDLTLRVGGRKWINSCGTTNFPSGEVYTGPIEDTANGHIRFTYPAVKSGKLVEDVQLTFENGKVSKATAQSGEDLLQAMIALDAGACYLGEFAIGTNYGVEKFTKNTLFDEKIGGTIHLALGAGYPATGSTNRSALHWDMICDMRDGGEIYADGELFYKNGKALI